MLWKGVRRSREAVTPLYRSAINLAMKQDRWPVVFSGPPGTGKTCAILSLCDYLKGRCFVWTAADLVEHLTEARRGNLTDSAGARIQVGAVWQRIEDADLVCIDDLGDRGAPAGIYRYQAAEADAVKRVLDRRPGRPTILCTNLRMSELRRRYSPAIVSRLAGGIVCEDWSLPDRRRR